MGAVPKSARRSNITIYNCSYQPVESIDAFVEALIISMSGCGVGYSVESKYVENFPRIKRQTGAAPDLHVVEDSAEGWAQALRFGLERWFEGGDVRFDTSLIREAGAPLMRQGLNLIHRRVGGLQVWAVSDLDPHEMAALGEVLTQAP